METTTVHYEVRSLAERTKECKIMKYNIGDIFEVKVGEWHGMGGWSQPSWSEYGATRFSKYEDALNSYKSLPTTMADFTLYGEPSIFKITTTTTVDENIVTQS